jgi:hypothetical protein
LNVAVSANKNRVDTTAKIERVIELLRSWRGSVGLINRAGAVAIGNYTAGKKVT